MNLAEIIDNRITNLEIAVSNETLPLEFIGVGEARLDELKAIRKEIKKAVHLLVVRSAMGRFGSTLTDEQYDWLCDLIEKIFGKELI